VILQECKCVGMGLLGSEGIVKNDARSGRLQPVKLWPRRRICYSDALVSGKTVDADKSCH